MLLSVPKETLDATIQIIVEELAVPIYIHGEPLVIPVEIKVSDTNWGEMKDVGVFNKLGG